MPLVFTFITPLHPLFCHSTFAYATAVTASPGSVFAHTWMKHRPVQPHQLRRSRVRPQISPPSASALPVALGVLAIAALVAAAAFAWALRSPTTVEKLLQQASDAELAQSQASGSMAVQSRASSADATPRVRRARVVAEYPHALDAFTQGLSWYKGDLIESTGMYGLSTVRRVELETGRVLARTDMPMSEFGEGSAAVRDELLQVSWKTGNGYVYSLPDLALKSTFSYKGDGWGLATDIADPDTLYLSDGSERIRVMRWQRHQKDGSGGALVEVRSFVVRNGVGGPAVSLLNELEMVDDNELWANIWMSELVARIDVASGFVIGWVDMRGLLTAADVPSGHRVDVLNGIVRDRESGRLYVTGKYWPKLFEIEVPDAVTATSIRFLNPFFTDRQKVERIMASTL
jgi:glutaminyl-peptide cyclotransferase